MGAGSSPHRLKKQKNGETNMEDCENEGITTIEFERESVLNIRGMRIIVTSHFDDSQEGLKEKIARLLVNDVRKMVGQPLISEEESVS